MSKQQKRHLAALAATAIAAMAVSTTPGHASAQADAAAPSNAERNILTWPMPTTVSPEGRAMAATLARAPMPSPAPPVAVQRKLIGDMQEAMGQRLQARYGVRIASATIAGVPVRIVYPHAVTALGRGPVLINLHGGGFQLDSGSLTETIPIAALTGVPVVAVLYRLAPEHPYPAALDDALAVYRALAKDRPAARLAVYGTSAGAVLAGQLIAGLQRSRLPMPAALGFFSGSADMGQAGDSETWMPLPGGAATLADSVASYLGTADRADPVVSPLRGDLSGFPPTLLVTSTRDMLLSGTSLFGRALVTHGVDARLVVFDGLPHAF